MASVSGDDWKSVMDEDDMDTRDAERILDAAIDLLNIEDCQLSNMSGAAGSKTVTLTSKQRGGVFYVARVIFYSYFKGIEDVAIGGMSFSTKDLLSDPTVVEAIKYVAARLRTDSYQRIPFVVAHDDSGIS